MNARSAAIKLSRPARANDELAARATCEPTELSALHSECQMVGWCCHTWGLIADGGTTSYAGQG